MDMQETKYKLYMMRKPLTVLALLLLIVFAAYLFSGPAPNVEEQGEALGDLIRAGKAPMPAFSSTTEARLKASKGFQALVSYTDTGFEPTELTIKEGETIRFTNNSSDKLWVAASGKTIYPAGGGCASSAFDSCAAFEPMDYWEFTFSQSGEWDFVNNIDKTKGGVVRVNVE